MRKYSLLLLLVIFVSACAPRPYMATNMQTTIRNHKTVAILPPNVAIQLRPGQMKRTTTAQVEGMEEKMSYNIQNSVYSWILRKEHRMNYSVKFQDITTTNAKLKSANIDYNELKRMDPQEIAKILSVDAVLDMNINADKPMSDGAAIALGMVFGFWGSTNHTQVITNIHDGTTGDLMWKMTLQANGSAGSSPEQLTRSVMKRTARKFPYRRPR